MNTMKSKKGEAMIVVMAILAILTALGLTLLLSASTLLGAAKKESLNKRCQVLAVSFSKQTEKELLDNENSNINKYIKEEIVAKRWLPYDQDNKKETTKEFTIATGSNDNSLYELGHYLEGYNLASSMSWSGRVQGDGTSSGDYNGIIITVNIIATKDKESFQAVNHYKVLANDSSWSLEREDK